MVLFWAHGFLSEPLSKKGLWLPNSEVLPYKCPAGAPRSQMPGDVGCTSGCRVLPGSPWIFFWLLCPALDRKWGSSFGP